jgi:GntR family transcriptional regulator/MocR family aminotransferase
VVLLGTFAKTLTPALATGFVVVPPGLLDAVTRVRARLGQPVNLVTQRALADYLDSGALLRHTQRMRNLYRRRRTQVVRALRGLPGVEVYPMDGGLHAVVEHSQPEDSVLARLAGRGVVVSALSGYWAGGGSRRGLVFGFGGVSDADLSAGLAAIREALAP